MPSRAPVHTVRSLRRRARVVFLACFQAPVILLCAGDETPVPVPLVFDALRHHPARLQGGALVGTPGSGSSAREADSALDFGLGYGQLKVVSGPALVSCLESLEFSVAFRMKRYDQATNALLTVVGKLVGNSREYLTVALATVGPRIVLETGTALVEPQMRMLRNRASAPLRTPHATNLTNLFSWVQCVLTFRQNDLLLYSEGVEVGRLRGEPVLPAEIDGLCVTSSEVDGALTLHGCVDDFAIFCRPLGQESLGRLSRGTLPPDLAPVDPPLAYWDFNARAWNPPSKKRAAAP